MANHPEVGSDPNQKVRSDSLFVSILELLTHWRRFIFICVLLGLVSSTIVAFLIPPKFKSTASVFPAEKADLFGALEGVSSLVKSFSPRSLVGLAGSGEVDKYVAILKSDRVLSAVIKKFDLVRVYEFVGASYANEKTVRELLGNLEFVIEPEGNLTITAFDTDPKRAAAIANFLVEALNSANSALQSQNATGNRRFIEERYEKNMSDLAAAEDSLLLFQKRFGIIAMPQQAEASVKAGAELAAQLAMKEVQLGVLRKTQSPDHPSVVATRIEIEEIKRKIQQMSVGGVDSQRATSVFVPFKQIPDFSADYVRRFREVEIQYKILQFLTPLYEQAKVEEKRQTPSVIVLDHAGPAERKAKPKRSLIMLGGVLVGFLSSLFCMAITERWRAEKSRNSEFYVSATRFLHSILTDAQLIFRRRSRGQG